MTGYDRDFGRNTLHLKYFHVEKDDEGQMVAYGYIYRHKKIRDGTYVHTSLVERIHTDLVKGIVKIVTQNNRYLCPALYLDFAEQEEFKDLIPDFEELKEKVKAILEG